MQDWVDELGYQTNGNFDMRGRLMNATQVKETVRKFPKTTPVRIHMVSVYVCHYAAEIDESLSVCLIWSIEVIFLHNLTNLLYIYVRIYICKVYMCNNDQIYSAELINSLIYYFMVPHLM